MSDLIKIKDLEIFAKIGCSEKERQCAQKISLNLSLKVDGSRAAASKDLKDSVCYLTLCNHVRELTASKEYALVEELTYYLADSCLARFELLQELSIEVKKYVLPATSYVSFTTTRTRLESK